VCEPSIPDENINRLIGEGKTFSIKEITAPPCPISTMAVDLSTQPGYRISTHVDVPLAPTSVSSHFLSIKSQDIRQKPASTSNSSIIGQLSSFMQFDATLYEKKKRLCASNMIEFIHKTGPEKIPNIKRIAGDVHDILSPSSCKMKRKRLAGQLSPDGYWRDNIIDENFPPSCMKLFVEDLSEQEFPRNIMVLQHLKSARGKVTGQKNIKHVSVIAPLLFHHRDIMYGIVLCLTYRIIPLSPHFSESLGAWFSSPYTWVVLVICSVRHI